MSVCGTGKGFGTAEKSYRSPYGALVAGPTDHERASLGILSGRAGGSSRRCTRIFLMIRPAH